MEIHLEKQGDAADFISNPWIVSAPVDTEWPFSIDRCNGRTNKFIRLRLTYDDEQFSFKDSKAPTGESKLASQIGTIIDKASVCVYVYVCLYG